jgi:ATP-dependent DNA helicase DinG
MTLEVHAAPINPADLLARYLFHPEDENGKE